MLRIRRIDDELTPINREALRQVKEILRDRFSDVRAEEIEKIGCTLSNPLKQRLQSILYVAENLRNRLQGFALLWHEPDIGFCNLDGFTPVKEGTGSGIGWS
jgi:hypothetical protein